MYFASFYQASVMTGEPIEACGDRSVIILDGRQHAADHHRIAAQTARERGYIGYSLHKGETLNRVSASTGFYPVKGSN